MLLLLLVGLCSFLAAQENPPTEPPIAPGQTTPVSLGNHTFVLRTVVIDPGHGGRDPGNVGHGGVLEKTVNLQIARTLALELGKRGLAAHLLRTSDRRISLEERGKLANVYLAHETLFVSLHCNAWEDEDVLGMETYVFDFKASDVDAARVALRENFGQEMTPFDYILSDLHHRGSQRYSLEAARRIQNTAVARLHTRNRHVRRAPLRVLGYVQVPAVLVEVGFLTNSREAKLLQQAEYQGKAASAIADGIQAFQTAVKSWDKNTASQQ